MNIFSECMTTAPETVLNANKSWRFTHSSNSVCFCFGVTLDLHHQLRAHCVTRTSNIRPAMKCHDNIRPAMKCHGNIRPAMKCHGNIRPAMKCHGNIRPAMKCHGNIRPAMKCHGNIRPAMKCHDNIRPAMKRHGNIRPAMKCHDSMIPEKIKEDWRSTLSKHFLISLASTLLLRKEQSTSKTWELSDRIGLCENCVQSNLWITTNEGTGKMWSNFSGGLICQMYTIHMPCMRYQSQQLVNPLEYMLHGV